MKDRVRETAALEVLVDLALRVSQRRVRYPARIERDEDELFTPAATAASTRLMFPTPSVAAGESPSLAVVIAVTLEMTTFRACARWSKRAAILDITRNDLAPERSECAHPLSGRGRANERAH